MINKKNNLISKKIKICFFILFLAALMLRPSSQPAQALLCWWAPCDGLFTKAWEQVKGAALAKLKQAAAETVNSIVTGGAGKSVIADWEDFLYKNAKTNAENVLNDYLTNTVTNGKGSSSGYIPKDVAEKIKAQANDQVCEGVGPDAFVIGLYQNDPNFINSVKAGTIDLASLSSLATSNNNYVSQLVEGAKKATFDKSSPVVTYVGNPSDMFKDGNFKNLSTYTSGINNPWAFKSDAEAKYQDTMDKTTEKAKAMGVAGQGFVGKIKDGIVQTPGSVFAGSVINAKDAGTKIMAAARDIPEVLIAAVTNLASSSVNDALSKGQSTLQNEINKQVTSAKKNITGNTSSSKAN